MIRFVNRAYIVFSQLSSADQGDINVALQTLEQAAQITSTNLYVRELDASDDIYLLAVGPKWRILLQKHGNEVHVFCRVHVVQSNMRTLREYVSDPNNQARRKVVVKK